MAVRDDRKNVYTLRVEEHCHSEYAFIQTDEYVEGARQVEKRVTISWVLK